MLLDDINNQGSRHSNFIGIVQYLIKTLKITFVKLKFY